MSRLFHDLCLMKFLAEEIRRLAWKEAAMQERGKLAEYQAAYDLEWAEENMRLFDGHGKEIVTT